LKDTYKAPPLWRRINLMSKKLIYEFIIDIVTDSILNEEAKSFIYLYA